MKELVAKYGWKLIFASVIIGIVSTCSFLGIGDPAILDWVRGLAESLAGIGVVGKFAKLA